MNNETGKTVLITGATQGIGYELAKLFAKDFYNLVLVARNENKLKEIKADLSKNYKIEILTISKDLSKPTAALEIFNETVEKQIVIDFLVNNAGIGDFARFHEQDFLKITEILQINIVSLTQLTRLFISKMLIKKGGKILNVSSMAAFQPGPYMAVYYASKAYVQSFSEAITSELKGTGITVTTLCPGPTKSGFQHSVGSENSNLVKYNLLSTAEEVAKEGYKALHAGREIEIPGLLFTTLFNISKLIPRKTKTRIIKKLQELNRS